MRHNTYKNGAGVLFCPVIDKINDYNTVVYNVNSQTTLKVNGLGYSLLEILENNPGISLDSLVDKYSRSINKPEWKVKNEVEIFIKQMIKENILIVE